MIFGNRGEMTAIEIQKNETANLWKTDVKITRSQIFETPFTKYEQKISSPFKEGLYLEQVHKNWVKALFLALLEY